MSYSWHLSELLVIGYADEVGPETVPTAVPPIFQERDGDVIVMPPYRLKGPLVETEIIGGQSDLVRAVGHRNATVLARARAAKPNRIMWVDEKLKGHYQKATRNGLLRLARMKQRRAERAALHRDLEAAMQNVNAAISADPTNPDSFALKALLLEHSPDADLVEVLLSAAPGDIRVQIDEQIELLRERLKLEG